MKRYIKLKYSGRQEPVFDLKKRVLTETCAKLLIKYDAEKQMEDINE